METRSERLAYLGKPSQSELTEDARVDYVADWENLLQQRPGYAEFHDLLGVFDHGELSNRKKEEYVRDAIHSWYEHPDMVEGVFHEAIRLRDIETDEVRKKIIQKVVYSLEKQLSRIGRYDAFDSEQDTHVKTLEAWVKLYMHSDALRDVMGGALTSLFEQEATEEGMERFVYNLHALTRCAYGATPDIRIELVKVLSFQTDILPPTREIVDLYLAPNYAQDKEMVQRYNDLDTAATRLLQMYSQEAYEHQLNTINEHVLEIVADPKSLIVTLSKKLAAADDPNARAVKEYQQFVQKNRNSMMAKNEMIAISQNPFFRQLSDPRTATKLRGEYLAHEVAHHNKTGGTQLENMYMPGIGVIPMRTFQREQKKVHIRSAYEVAEPEHIDHPSAVRTLVEYCRVDDESVELVEAMSETLSELKRRLKYEARCLVSPRGDKIVFAKGNEYETNLGLKSITFLPDTSVVDLLVDVEIGNVTTRLRVNDRFEILHTDHTPVIGSDAVEEETFSLLVLGALSEVMFEPAAEGTKSSETEESGTLQVRRPHIRKLPAGKKYTEAQAAIALSKYGLDLVRYNMDRRGGPDAPYYTFVSEVSVGLDEAKKLGPNVREVTK